MRAPAKISKPFRSRTNPASATAITFRGVTATVKTFSPLVVEPPLRYQPRQHTHRNTIVPR
jgi:hypothetical protein